MVDRVGPSVEQPQRLGPVDQSHDGVVTHQQVPRDVADRRILGSGVTTYGQQQLVLRRSESKLLCPLLAPLLKAPQLRAEPQQLLVVLIGQRAHHPPILSDPEASSLFYRTTIESGWRWLRLAPLTISGTSPRRHGWS